MSRLISLSVYTVRPSHEELCPFVKTGESPVIQLEVLGETHTFKDLGEAIFTHYLHEIRNEQLSDHMWRFELYPEQKESDWIGSNIDNTKAFLSPDMIVHIQDLTRIHTLDQRREEPSPVKEGSQFLFVYDYGPSVHLLISFDRIHPLGPLPEGRSVQDYPRRVPIPTDVEPVAKRQRITAAPILTTRMDDAYPHLRKRLLHERVGEVSITIGRGCEPAIGDTDAPPDAMPFCIVWGGGEGLATYQRSVECYTPFSDIDEFFICLDKAIEKQVSPGYPHLLTKRKMKKPSGETYMVNTDPPVTIGPAKQPFQVIANLYPSTTPPSVYRDTMVADLPGSYMLTAAEKSEGIKCVQSWSTWCFNYSLPPNWQTNPSCVINNSSRFSFAKQFPKCAKWLASKQTGTYYWMKIERGILSAIKGRAHMMKEDNVVFHTMKHNNLHDMFEDLENQLVIPKSWK